ncbi:hypothetical protein MBLNU13_g06614t3 [Cladosporium sp. NU13]
MSFNQDFEAEVNSNMNPSRQSISKDVKAPIPTSSRNSCEAEDLEFNEKMAMKGHSQLPPRFSTIFDTKGPAAPAREFESYPQPPVGKAGIYVAKPLFWALFTIFLFESAVLFAYTVIGLVSNMSSKLVHVNGAGAVVAGCDCNTQPINISPNFFMQGGTQASFVETTILSTTASTTLTTSTSSVTSQGISPGVSELAEIIKSAGTASTSETSTHTPTTHIVTVTPPGSTIKSTTVLTVDASGSTLPPRPTVTSTKVVAPDEASPTLDTRDEPTSPSLIPTMSLSLKSHQELASKPTQESETAPAPTTEPSPSEPTETVSTPSTTIPEPTPTCTKSNRVWGASGRIWGGVVCK